MQDTLCVGVSSDSRWIGIGNKDHTLIIINSEDRYFERVRELKGHQGGVWSLCFSECNQWVVSGSFDTTVRIWRMSNYSQVAVLRGHDRSVESVCISADGKWIA